MLASGVGMTRRFGTCRGARLDEVRDDEDVDGAFPTYCAFIAAIVCDGGSKRRGESCSGVVVVFGGEPRGVLLRRFSESVRRVPAGDGWPP